MPACAVTCGRTPELQLNLAGRERRRGEKDTNRSTSENIGCFKLLQLTTILDSIIVCNVGFVTYFEIKLF